MANYLTIDQGNSEAKITFWNDTELVDSVIEARLTPSSVESFVNGRPLSGAIYCSVVQNNGPVINKLSHLARCVYRLSPSTPLPINIDYATPNTLGSDRVAAAVGAWSDFKGRDILVIDAGTAVTYDYVDASGTFRGGNIAPGITMELKALNQFTARLPLIPFPENMGSLRDTIIGRDTAEAITLGAVYSVVASIGYYRSRLPKDTVVVLGGGCGHHLASLCDFDVHVDEHLASKGLNRILLYNEN
ncbi:MULTISPECIES: type III pantothenate kinase [Duncaniella]|jgi:type III pantothenate kinase|uniref:Type III pantothenate kinase n=1 Tax=Duncaniella dubosii TaxID=2518971 RepID=A0A4P7W2T0_9BACT|nr:MULTISPECIES: type III pantothenate kinase [Duncaniella]MBJ2190521.1 type III pantothenate kinase [Muribaculaceae bacterium]ROS89711.1 type III pantothenate kinase [Muribaculaceae bacterium Isolate-080 (Janvier)]HBN63323.1 pantothenate kinase [Porphyromonadaceae bacterium]MCX4283076.1 type III pantothenate kinase [Duncaniella dubosii]QCD42132.1 type III pantothenate kinase [Duncaniella dubosii]